MHRLNNLILTIVLFLTIKNIKSQDTSSITSLKIEISEIKFYENHETQCVVKIKDKTLNFSRDSRKCKIDNTLFWLSYPVTLNSNGLYFHKEDFSTIIKPIIEYNKTTPEENANYKEISVLLDPGHGGNDPGCVYSNISEKDIVLKIAIEVKNLLSTNNWIKIYMTRTNDIYISLWERNEMVKLYSPNIFVSIHANWCSNVITRGTEIYKPAFPNNRYKTNSYDKIVARLSDSTILAWRIHQNMNRNPDFMDRGIKSSNFQVIQFIDSPAVLVECEFLSNDKGRDMLLSNDGVTSFAEAIAKGIMDYIEYKSNFSK